MSGFPKKRYRISPKNGEVPEEEKIQRQKPTWLTNARKSNNKCWEPEKTSKPSKTFEGTLLQEHFSELSKFM